MNHQKENTTESQLASMERRIGPADTAYSMSLVPENMDTGTGNCIHHYVIAPADGSTWLASYCKKCGDSKQFRATPAQNKYVTQKFIVIDKDKSTEDIAAEESKDEDEW